MKAVSVAIRQGLSLNRQHPSLSYNYTIGFVTMMDGSLWAFNDRDGIGSVKWERINLPEEPEDPGPEGEDR